MSHVRSNVRPHVRASVRPHVRAYDSALAFPTNLLGDVVARYESGAGIVDDGATISEWQDRGVRSSRGMWFDGVNDRVEQNLGTVAIGYFGACTISCKFQLPAGWTAGAYHTLFTHGFGSYRAIIWNDGSLRLVSGASDPAGFFPTAGTEYALQVDFNADGDAIAMRVDGVDQGIVAVEETQPNTTDSKLYVGARHNGVSTGLFFEGSIWDFEITGTNATEWRLDGNTDAAAVDQSGNSNDGTVVGAPSAAVPTKTGRREANDLPATVEWDLGTDAKGRTSPESDGTMYGETPYADGPYSQPWVRAVVAKADATTNMVLVDQDGASAGSISIVSGNWHVDCGTLVDTGVAADTDTHVFAVIANGANSELWLDGLLVASGNFGSDGLTGVAVLADSAGANGADGQVEALVDVDVADAAEASEAVGLLNPYLAARQGVTI